MTMATDKTILIIEDDTDINNMLRKLLAGHGYNTVSAYSGTEGVLVRSEERKKYPATYRLLCKN